ncbi:hypothetical protein F383_30920 [Gossypium arboreum]|uniref:Uncharacterized protein n=1 Tax=Gossypium arboreum TaxID=29729 RepID=A0A0B0PBD3_GOSAR|nr:hypothetical protein F383_30920 [Gossypium arboreum]
MCTRELNYMMGGAMCGNHQVSRIDLKRSTGDSLCIAL